MTGRRVVQCKECEAHFEAPSRAVLDTGPPEQGIELRCPVCCARGHYSSPDVIEHVGKESA